MQRSHKPTTTEQRFGEVVHAARIGKGWSQRELAERLTRAGVPVDASAVSRIEKGTRALRLSEAVTVADVLGQGLPAMLGGEPTDPYAELRSAKNAHRKKRQALIDALVDFMNSRARTWTLSDAAADDEEAAELVHDARSEATDDVDDIVTLVTTGKSRVLRYDGAVVNREMRNHGKH